MLHRFVWFLLLLVPLSAFSQKVVVETVVNQFPPSDPTDVGRVIQLTTTADETKPRGLWVYVGGDNKWSPINGGIVNVADFGARPDDTEVDSAAIQQAVDAAGDMPKGGTVYFPAGVYLINDQIEVKTAGVWLRGAGMTSTRLKAVAGIADNDAVIKFDQAIGGPASGITDLMIWSEVANNTWPGVWIDKSLSVFADHLWTNGLRTGVKLTESGDCVVESSVLEGSYDYGLYAHKTSPLRIHDTEAFANLVGGFHLQTAKPTKTIYEQTHPVVISNCQSMFSTESAHAQVGFKIEGYENVTLVAPQVGDLNYEVAHGIWIVNSHRVNVIGANVTHSKNYGIKIEGSSEVSVTGAVVNATGYYPSTIPPSVAGIYADGSSRSISIVGGSINKSQGNGIVFGAANGQISDVSIIDPGMSTDPAAGWNGIEIAQLAMNVWPDVTIANNSFRIGSTPVGRTAIRVSAGGGPAAVVISGNIQEGFPTGLVIHPLTTRRVFGNIGFLNDHEPGITIATAALTPLNVTNAIHSVTGTDDIATITVPPWCGSGCTIALVPKGEWKLVTGGNIAANATAVLNRTMHVTWVAADTLWYPSYN